MPGKHQPVNGFTLFVQELRRRMRQRGDYVPSDWAELRDIASEEWMGLPMEEQLQFKQAAKEQKAQDRHTKRGRRHNQLRDEFAAISDELDLLEQFHRKREHDVKRLCELWEWDCGHERNKQKEKRFCFISCQSYGQQAAFNASTATFQPEEDSALASIRHFPAEISFLEFSIDRGVLQKLHRIMKLTEHVKGEVCQLMEENAELYHGIEPFKGSSRSATGGAERVANSLGISPEEPSSDWRQLYHDLAEIFERRGRLFCFSRDWIPTLGCLQYVADKGRPAESDDVGGRDFLITQPSSQLICVEDLLSASFAFHGLADRGGREAVSPVKDDELLFSYGGRSPLVTDIQQVILEQIDSAERRRCECTFHCLLNERQQSMGGFAKRSRCSLWLAESAVALLRRWIQTGQIDEEARESYEKFRRSVLGDDGGASVLSDGGSSGHAARVSPFVADYILENDGVKEGGSGDQTKTDYSFAEPPFDLIDANDTRMSMELPTVAGEENVGRRNDSRPRAELEAYSTLGVRFGDGFVPQNQQNLDQEFSLLEFERPVAQHPLGFGRQNGVVGEEEAVGLEEEQKNQLGWKTFERSLPVNYRGVGRGLGLFDRSLISAQFWRYGSD